MSILYGVQSHRIEDLAMIIKTAAEAYDGSDYGNYKYFNCIKFIKMISEISNNERLKTELTKLLDVYKPNESIRSNYTPLEIRLGILENEYSSAIAKANMNFIYDGAEFKTIIRTMNDEMQRKSLFLARLTMYYEVVRLMPEIMSIRREIAKINGHSSWFEYTNSRTNGGKPIVQIKKIIEDAKKKYPQTIPTGSLQGYNYAYTVFNNYNCYKIDADVLYNSVLTFVTKMYGYTYRETPVTCYWVNSNTKGIKEFAINKNDKLYAIILLDSIARKSKPATAYTDTIVSQCIYSPDHEVPVVFVTLPHDDTLIHEDVVRTMHEFGHAFDIINRSSRALPWKTTGLNGVPRQQVELASTEMEKRLKDPNVLSQIILRPIDDCKKAIALAEAADLLDWRHTIAKAEFDIYIHDSQKDFTVPELIELFNNHLTQTTGINYNYDAPLVGTLPHFADYSARYYTYLMGAVPAPITPQRGFR